jgi:hypothetical protein
LIFILKSPCEADPFSSQHCCCSTSLLTTVRRFYVATGGSPYFMHVIVDLNALAWLEDYLQTWQGTLLVVYVAQPYCIICIIECSPPRSHDRAFL